MTQVDSPLEGFGVSILGLYRECSTPKRPKVNLGPNYNRVLRYSIL